MNQEHIDFLATTFIFQGVGQNTCRNLLKDINIEEHDYRKGDVIYSPLKFDRKIGFVKDGECLITRPSSTAHNVLLNIAKKGDSFGITSVFSTHDSFPTTITAKTFCSVFFLSSENLMQIMQKNHIVALNIIKFLTERIEFLNERIAAFSGISVEDKLVSHILSLQKRHGTSEFIFNKKSTAEALSCGRASLYRAMENLITKGYVKFDNKKIYILDLTGLERMSK